MRTKTKKKVTRPLGPTGAGSGAFTERDAQQFNAAIRKSVQGELHKIETKILKALYVKKPRPKGQKKKLPPKRRIRL